MALCINQSGTWRNITTLCVNQSGTWRNIVTGCINDSGTWRKFSAGSPGTTLGASFGGGTTIWIQSTGFATGGIVWVVAPNTTEVSRTWYCRDDAVTTAQANAACGDWFVPSVGQLQNPGYACRTYWDSNPGTFTWSSTESDAYSAVSVAFGAVGAFIPSFTSQKVCTFVVRAFRCVTY